jgi:hypothetical protein
VGTPQTASSSATRNTSASTTPVNSASVKSSHPNQKPPTPTYSIVNTDSSNNTQQTTPTQQFINQQNFAKMRSSSTNSPPSLPIPITNDKDIDQSSAKQQESLIIDSLESKHATCSPNAKLPPLRNPKSKLIMKNMQNKQKQQIESAGQPQPNGTGTVDTAARLSSSAKTNSAINQDAPQTNEAIASAVDSANEDLQEKSNVSSGRIQRSSSSSVLEKR